MKNISKLLASLILAATAIAAGATPLVDTVSANVPVTPATPYSFVININDDAVAYDPILNKVTDASILFRLSDPNGKNEKYTITVGTNGTTVSGVSVANSGFTPVTIGLSAADLQDLSLDGLINVTLSVALQGVGPADYVFFDSTLNAEIGLINANTAPTRDVPEPASLGLFGITLLGLGAARKRKQK